MEWLPTLIVPVLLIVEYFLGQTSIVKPNSTVELILDIVKTVLEVLKEKYKPNKK